MISQLWFRWWLGAVRQQAIAWTNVDQTVSKFVSIMAVDGRTPSDLPDEYVDPDCKCKQGIPSYKDAILTACVINMMIYYHNILYKDVIQYRNSHYKYDMVSRPFHLCNGNPFTWKDALYIETGPSRQSYDDVIQWKHFPRYWLFVWGIHSLPVNSPHKCQ